MISFEQIQEANKQIKTTDIKGKDYAEVNQRIKAFRMCFPNGTIETKIVSLVDTRVVMQAIIKDEEGKMLGTGYAYEIEGSSFINKSSFIENCETSAVGRALGMCGFGIDTSLASYEEVANAELNQPWKDRFFEIVAEKKLDANELAIKYKLNGKVSEERFKEVCEDLCKTL